MNETTKNILLAVGTVAGIVLIFFLINRYKRMQALKRMREQQTATAATAATAETAAGPIIITGVPDWNNSKVATSIKFGFFTWFGEITPTTYKTETRADQVIKITGGASSAKIELLQKDKVVKEANIDFYNEKLNGFN